jgi:hypothetical protein
VRRRLATPSEPTANEPSGPAPDIRPRTIRFGAVLRAYCGSSTALTEPVAPM